MKTDRDLLELAAKAAGIVSLKWGVDSPDSQISGGGQFLGATWNPLTDDGDAFRLMLQLGICLVFMEDADFVAAEHSRHGVMIVEAMGDLETRRAITRAAAKIGEQMP